MIQDTVAAAIAARRQRYPMIDCERRVVDPATGAEAPSGGPGELLVRGYTVMDGYWDNSVATAAAIDRDGWMHTGDMALLRPA